MSEHDDTTEQQDEEQAPRDQAEDEELEDLELDEDEGVTERVRGGRMRATSIP